MFGNIFDFINNDIRNDIKSDANSDKDNNDENQKGYSVELFLKAALILGRSFYTPDEAYRLSKITPIVNSRIPSLSFCERLGRSLFLLGFTRGRFLFSFKY